MIRIERTKRKQYITLDDFMKLKVGNSEISGLRSMAKGANFSLIFGASASTYARTSLLNSWTEQQADQYIAQNRLFGLKEQIIQRSPRETPKMQKLITCATDIRNKFFQTYPGLMTRIERERQFAMNNGYVRCWHGACRRIPELLLASKKLDDAGNYSVSGEDKSIYGGHIHNVQNVSANTSIQGFEAAFVMQAITQIHNEFKTRGMKSYIFGTVHDSIDFCVHKDEVKQFYNIVKQACETDQPLFQGMPMAVDFDMADLNDGDYYKTGKDIASYL